MKARSLGFVLQHQYSFDGVDTLPLDRLRGRDLLLVDVFQALIKEWRHSTSVRIATISVVPCQVVREQLYKRELTKLNEGSAAGYRVVRHVTARTSKQLSSEERPLVTPGAPRLNSYKSTLTGTHLENDGKLKHRFWPFW